MSIAAMDDVVEDGERGGVAVTEEAKGMQEVEVAAIGVDHRQQPMLPVNRLNV